MYQAGKTKNLIRIIGFAFPLQMLKLKVFSLILKLW